MPRVNSLESFLDAYIKNLAIKNEPESFSAYSSATLHEINKKRRESELKALEDHAFSTRPYGRRDEILSSYGLYDSGYKSYYDALKASEAADAISAAKQKAISSERAAYKGYLDYLESETKRQRELESSVTNQLAESKIIDPIEIYKYAVESGMTKDRAESAITKVYNSVKNTVKRDILERIASNEYDVDLAVAYAKSIGLKDDDIEEIRKLAEKIEDNFSIYTQSFDEVDDLESLGNQTNSSH
jgi:hypothetical protein